jgi:nitroreductase family protein
MNGELTFGDTVRLRHSARAFLPDPLPRKVIDEVLEEAQLAPSNCNTQPWVVHIASGAKRDALSAALLHAAREGHYSPDFQWSVEDYPGRFRERQMQQGKVYYETLAIARHDVATRGDATMANYTFFDAPPRRDAVHAASGRQCPGCGGCRNVCSDAASGPDSAWSGRSSADLAWGVCQCDSKRTRRIGRAEASIRNIVRSPGSQFAGQSPGDAARPNWHECHVS